MTDDSRLSRIEKSINDLEKNQALLVQTLTEVKNGIERLAEISERMVRHETQLNDFKGGTLVRVNRIEERIDDLSQRQTRMFYWLIGILGGLLTNLAGRLIGG